MQRPAAEKPPEPSGLGEKPREGQPSPAGHAGGQAGESRAAETGQPGGTKPAGTCAAGCADETEPAGACGQPTAEPAGTADQPAPEPRRAAPAFGAPVMAMTGGVEVQSRDVGRTEQQQARSAQVRAASGGAAVDAPTRDTRTLEEKVEATMASLTRRPRLRDILYDLLLYCAEERTFEEAEAFVASHAAYRASDSSPHTVASILVRSGALDRLAYDAQGEPVTEERLLELQQTGATQEELEDLVASESLIVSEAGQEAADRFDPRQRVLGLLDEGPERANAYRRLLEKLAQSPCHFGALDETLRPALAALPPTADGQRLQTGFFVDALSAADAIRWTAAAGWNVTEAGRELLEALQASANQ